MEEDYQKPAEMYTGSLAKLFKESTIAKPPDKPQKPEKYSYTLYFKEPRPDGGVEEFRKCKPSLERFARDIDRGLKVSRKSLEWEINI